MSEASKFHPAEHAGRSSLDTWKLQRCGLGPSSLSAGTGTTDQEGKVASGSSFDV